MPAFIVRGHRQPIHLQFGYVLVCLSLQQIAHAAVKIAQFAFVERIVQAQHRRAVLHLHEPFARLSADSLRRRIGRDQVRMLRFEILQPAHQRIVLGIGDLRLVQHVIQPLVTLQFFAQAPDLFFRRHVFLVHYNWNGERRIATYQNTVLIYNPVAGRLRGAGERKIQCAAAALKSHGMRVKTVATSAPGAATALAKRAVDDGADLILAAGGDGTINEAANGVIGTAVPFGILPGGTANVLSMELGFGTKLDRAVNALTQCAPQRIAVGRLTNDLGSRYFLMMAGAGLDAEIVYSISARLKESWGKLAYWMATSARLTRNLPEFEVRANGRELRCGFALASRVKNYGGDLSIATGASLMDDNFELVSFRGRSPLRYMAYFLGVATRTLPRFRGITIERCRKLTLAAPEDSRIYVQVDGEFAGHLPATLEIVPDALTLMIPADFRERLGLRIRDALMPAAG